MVFEMTKDLHVVLASASPRRKELLQGLGWNFSVVPSNVPEDFPQSADPEEGAIQIARRKAEDIARIYPKSLVIAADTVVVLGGKIFGKPKNQEEAYFMLRTLANKQHDVITAIALSYRNECITDAEKTKVWFRSLMREDIEAYVSLGECFDKAGAYGIQGRGALLIEKIEGCFYNVMGLPLFRLSKMLERLGIPLNVQWGLNR